MVARYRVPRTARPAFPLQRKVGFAQKQKILHWKIGTLHHCHIKLTAKSAKYAQMPQRFAQGKFGRPVISESANSLISSSH